MRVGFISDIHGNLFALEAVLADLERQELDRVVCLGDICFGPQAHECLERVRELGCPVILGNWDSWSIDGFPPADDPVGIMLYEIGALVGRAPDRRGPRVRAHLRPDARGAARRTGRRCSASTARRARSRTGSSPRRPTTTSSEMFAGIDAPVLVGGHTHLQMLRRFGPSVIVNPGSVGQPFSQWWPQRDPGRRTGPSTASIDVERPRASTSSSAECRTTSTRCCGILRRERHAARALVDRLLERHGCMTDSSAGDILAARRVR